MEFHLTATGRHLPYGITQCYLPPDKWTRPAFTPASKPVHDLPTPEGWKAELSSIWFIHQQSTEMSRNIVSRTSSMLSIVESMRSDVKPSDLCCRNASTPVLYASSIYNHTNRKRVYIFLLVVNSNFDPMLHRFRDRPTRLKCRKSTIFPTPLLFRPKFGGVPFGVDPWCGVCRKRKD